MPRRCTVCDHSEREAIDRALAGGEALTAIAAEFRVSQDALGRHKAGHLAAAIQEAARADEEARSLDLLGEVKRLYRRAVGILDAAGKEPRTALGAIREARESLALLGKLLGQLEDRPVINILLSPQWVEVRTLLLAALAPYPEARAAAAQALLGAGDGERGP
jgi:hypothetical protein